MPGVYSCVSIYGRPSCWPEIAPAFPAYRPSMAINEEGPHWAGLLRVSFVESELREGPPEVGIIIRVIVVAAGGRSHCRNERGSGREAGGH